MTTAEYILLVVILIWAALVGPWFSIREMKKLRKANEDELPALRKKAYRKTIIEQWAVTAVLLAAWFALGRSPLEIGLAVGFAGWQWVAVGVSLLCVAMFAIYIVRASNDTEGLSEVREQLGSLALFAPHTRGELQGFGWLSITAGICEEIFYRGFLMTMLASLLGLWPAVFLSSLVFGIGHAYQGIGGIIRTGGVGLILALVVVFTGSLPVAILMHAVIDLVQGRLLWAAVRPGPEMAEAV